MGFFNINPVPGYSYYAIAKGKDGTEIKASLPQSFPTGVAIRTQVTPDKKLFLTVCTNEATLPSIAGHDFTVNLSSRNLVNQSLKIRIDSLVTNYLLPLDSLSDGIIRVTLSEFEGLPLAERLFFLQRNDYVQLNITTNKTEYKPREKVTIGLSLSGDPAFSGSGEFSFSAADLQYTDNNSPYPTSIASWFLLESDVRGQVEQPSYYFDPSNKERLQDLDLLLMTQGWREFKWKYDSLSAFRHDIGFMISGYLKRIINNKPIDGVKVNLGLFLKKSMQLFDTKTDKNGSYRFEELEVYGKTKAFISSTDKFERMGGRIFIDSVKYETPVIEGMMSDRTELTLVTKDYSSFQKEVIIKINNLKKYKLSDTLELGEVIVTTKRVETPDEVKLREKRKFYTTPDKVLKITPVQEDIPGDVFSFMSGRIPGVRVVRAVNGQSIYYPDDVQIYIRNQYIVEGDVKKGALILLDGYEIDESGLVMILTLPMNLIDRIDVLNASPLYGMRGANGVINIITRTGVRREPIELSPNSVYTTLRGFDIPRIFYSPKYDSKTEQTIVPDYRSTIFWEPDIKIEKNKSVKLDYFNADNTAAINITVEGITSEGIPVTGKASYKVK
jgi:hypothetical protein